MRSGFELWSLSSEIWDVKKWPSLHAFISWAVPASWGFLKHFVEIMSCCDGMGFE
jgi:hypothetical protein